jgi:mannitol-1-phosphate 5-dehydrogenase
VGFGFGPIQAGLFLYEAFRSGNFSRYIAAEISPDTIQALSDGSGWYSLNIAHSDRVEIARIGPVEIRNPVSEHDRHELVSGVREAAEIATALPSVQFYVTPGRDSIHRILADGLLSKVEAAGPPAIIYAAENHNHAAEMLEAAVLGEIPESRRKDVKARVGFLNTVIGKMSGAISDKREIEERRLAPVAPGEPRAFLVEAFNRILISRIRLGVDCYRRGIEIFEEKEDLLPFEEAKLYGHNATHSLAAYIAALRGLRRMEQLRAFPHILHFLRRAFLEESGAALIRRHAGIDPLFTDEGYRDYAEDLLARMLNPWLGDTVERVGRDPQRKLGWDDRLVGTIRIALRSGIQARCYAVGAAAGLAWLNPTFLDTETPVSNFLEPLWHGCVVDEDEARQVLSLIEDARRTLRRWLQQPGSSLENCT